MSDDVAPVELVEIDAGYQVVNHRSDHFRLLDWRSEHQYAVMGTWRVAPDVSKTPIQRDEQPLLIDRSSENPVVVMSAEMFSKNCVDVVSSLFQDSHNCNRNVLVELHPHASCSNVNTSSLASRAP